MIATEAWVLYQGPGARNERHEPGTLRREIYVFPDIDEDEVLTETLYGGWEANMSHAIERDPIDICRQRNEEKIVLGNSGVVRVLKTGSAVTHVREGDLCILFPHAITDKYGYIEKVLAYDAPQTMGLLARRAKFAGKHLVPIPPHTRASLPQWASMARYFSAWSNWQVAYKCLRSQISVEECPHPFVWGWGGGVALAELQLATFFGFRTFMIASEPERLALITQKGVHPIDRQQFSGLRFDPHEYEYNLDYKARYLEAERTFLRIVKEQTEGEGASIFIDNIGTPVYQATLKAMAREGVITTCGWKHGMEITYLRAIECIGRHIHVHTHGLRYDEGIEAMHFAEKQQWMPQKEDCIIYNWDDIPLLAQEYVQGKIVSYFPLFSTHPL
jgi:NADPH:quinone reductase-like Zn-dependent oxidoreductase